MEPMWNDVSQWFFSAAHCLLAVSATATSIPVRRSRQSVHATSKSAPALVAVAYSTPLSIHVAGYVSVLVSVLTRVLHTWASTLCLVSVYMTSLQDRITLCLLYDWYT